MEQDWADEVFNSICFTHSSGHRERDEAVDRWKFKAALRKAKADGVRQAAEILQFCSECRESDHIKEFLATAAKIEKGE